MMDTSVHQLYHILNAGKLTYCLICMEDICEKFNIRSEENSVKVHLSCPNHQENVKFLFKLCVPHSFDDESSTEDYFDIMARSVFDISNLMGEKTCYICCKNKNHLVCLLCREEVSPMEFSCKKIKKRIVSHLQSDRHLQSVKDTNWIYHFNSFKSFFRFHKSLLYCSICKESFIFGETNLLQFADSHLKNLHNVSYPEREEGDKAQVLQDKSETKTSELVAVATLGSSNSLLKSSIETTENSNGPQTEPRLPLIDKQLNNIYTCHLCLGDIEIIGCGIRYSIENHCLSNHLNIFKVEGSTLLKDIICFNQRFLDQKVVEKAYPGIKVLSDCVPVFGNNSKYIQIVENICFCSICSVMVLFDPDPNNLLRNFTTHFKSVEHAKVLKKKGHTGYDKAKKKSKDLKRLKQSPKPKDSKKSKKKKVDLKKTTLS